MTRGRRPEPVPLRVLRGNPQRRPLPDQPDASAGEIEMPPWLRLVDPDASGLIELTLGQLRERAASFRIRGRSRMDRDELIEAILEKRTTARETAWSEFAPVLQAMRIVTAADIHALALIVDAYVEYVELRRLLVADGLTYQSTGRNGYQVKRRPEAELASKRWDQVIRGFIEFGMTPASRSRVAVVPRGDRSKIAKLRERRRNS